MTTPLDEDLGRVANEVGKPQPATQHPAVVAAPANAAEKPPPSAAEINTMVNELINMGFEKGLAQQALVKCKYSVNRAANYLLR